MYNKFKMAYSKKSSHKVFRSHSKKHSAVRKHSAKVSRKMSKKSSHKKSHKKSPKKSCPAGQKRIRGFTRANGVKVKGHCSRPKGRKSPKRSQKMGFQYGFQDGEY